MTAYKVLFEVMIPVRAALTIDADTPFTAVEAIRSDCSVHNMMPSSYGFDRHNTIHWDQAKFPAVVSITDGSTDNPLLSELRLATCIGTDEDPDSWRILEPTELRLEWDAVTGKLNGPNSPVVAVSAEPSEATPFETSALKESMYENIRQVVRRALEIGATIEQFVFEHVEGNIRDNIAIFRPLDQNGPDVCFATISAATRVLCEYDQPAAIALLRTIAAGVEHATAPTSMSPEEISAHRDRGAEIEADMDRINTTFEDAVARRSRPS